MQENNVSENQLPFTLYAEKAKLTLTGEHELLSAGMTGVVQVEFLFSEDWNGLEKTAVFTNGTRTVKVSEAYWDDGVCVIPHEVLRTAGKTVMAGVYGTNGLHLVLPTVWCVLGRVEPAPDLSGEAVDPGPSLRAMERRLAALEQIPAVTEDTVSGWGFTKNALTQHQSLSGLVPRAVQAVKTALHTQRISIDENGALYAEAAAGVHGIQVSYYDGEYYSELTPAQIYGLLGEDALQLMLIDRYGRQCPLVSPPENDTDSPAKFFTVDASGSELVIHTVDVSGVVTSQSYPFPTRTSDLNNDSGYACRYPVTISQSGGVAVCDRTFAQVRAAMQNGAFIDVIAGTVHGWVGDADDTSVTFYAIDTSGGPAILYQSILTSGGLTVTSKLIESVAPTVQTVSGAAPSIDALNNTIYECGVCTSLTINAASNSIEFTVIFTSGSSPTLLTMPVAVSNHLPSGWTVEANTRYEIRIRKTYPVIESWPVSV